MSNEIKEKTPTRSVEVNLEAVASAELEKAVATELLVEDEADDMATLIKLLNEPIHIISLDQHNESE
jgi:hypothetical protein